ncbi:MAG: flagellar biosynthesis protein FliQ [Pseudomonadota bacterium]|jgi:flagellar biosynthesis protein FliQ|nr:flagellar biosynthesis protein FliQ [Pseudomonadota bacterium]MDQ5905878.1 flagellar biosynthesis protein FliQ [Pseudomonadota bacterium]MDQ5947448.1 flagellar biosynthesis protein FliQ [Pseudomonadota bacterium]
MTPQTVMELGRQALEMTLLVSAPMLMAALVTGLIISIFQAATQINESTLSFIPRLVVMFITLIFAGPWMLQLMIDYIRRLFDAIPGMLG